MIVDTCAREVRDYGASMLASARADWGHVRATVIRRERLGATRQRFILPWHVFRLGVCGAFSPGSTTRLSDGRPQRLTASGGSFYPAATAILNDVVAASRLTYLTVEIDPTLLTRCLEPAAVRIELAPVSDMQNPLTLSLLHNLRCAVAQGEGQRLFAEQAALMLLLTVRRDQSGCVESTGFRSGGLSVPLLARVKDYLADRVAEDISLRDLSELTGLSASHLCRAFKQSTGLTPNRWRANIRMERAKQFLRDSRLPLAQLALAIGFAGQSQFTTAFRRHTGVSPGVWRRSVS